MHHLYTILVDQVKSYFKLSVIIFAHLLRAGFFSSWDDPFDAFGSEKESKNGRAFTFGFCFPPQKASLFSHTMVVLVLLQRMPVKVFSMMDMAFITAPHRSIDDQ